MTGVKKIASTVRLSAGEAPPKPVHARNNPHEPAPERKEHQRTPAQPVVMQYTRGLHSPARAVKVAPTTAATWEGAWHVTDEGPRFYTIAEAADVLRCSTRTVENYLSEGLLPSFRMPRGRKRLITVEALDAFIAEHTAGPN